MAVLEAVRGWEELAGLTHINDVRKDGDSTDIKDDTEKSESKDEGGSGEEKQDDGMWSVEKLEKDLDGLVGTDYVSLLLEHEEHIRSPQDENSIRKLHVSLIMNSADYVWMRKCLTRHRISQILSSHSTRISGTPCFCG